MALSGDRSKEEIDKRASIRFLNQIHFTDEGLVNESIEDSTLHCLSDVIQVVEGDIDSVLPLIGYRKSDIRSHIQNDVFKATDAVIESMDALGPRSPGSHILVHNNSLYGVVVNHSNNCRVVGRITSVVPKKEPKDGLNVVIVEEEGIQTTCRSIDLNLKELVQNGAILCMISINGFAFIETNERTAEDIPDLILVVNRGYILFEGMPIDWIRLKTGLRINEYVVKTTTIAPKECIICLRSGYVREDNRLIVYGNQSGVLDFDAFLAFTNDLQTIGFETGQHFNTEDIKEFSGKAYSEPSQEVANLCIESNEELSESFDSEFDDISADSFS